MSNTEEELPIEERLARARKKRGRFQYGGKLRTLLNAAFLILSAIGLAVYFHTTPRDFDGIYVIAFAMLFKITDFILRVLY